MGGGMIIQPHEPGGTKRGDQGFFFFNNNNNNNNKKPPQVTSGEKQGASCVESKEVTSVVEWSYKTQAKVETRGRRNFGEPGGRK